MVGNGAGRIMCNKDSSCLFNSYVGNSYGKENGYNKVRVINGLELLDVSNVTNMRYMFASLCISQKDVAIDLSALSNWDTSKVTDMSNMFYQSFYWSNIFPTLDVSNWDTSNVTDMSNMFSSCSSLTTLDVSNFDTSNVTDMAAMFQDCSSLTSLDVSNFDTSKVTNMSYMFINSSNLTTIYVSNLWSTDAVIKSQYMFYNCTSLVGDIAYKSSYVDKTYATTTGGYLTYKAASNI